MATTSTHPPTDQSTAQMREPRRAVRRQALRDGYFELRDLCGVVEVGQRDARQRAAHGALDRLEVVLLVARNEGERLAHGLRALAGADIIIVPSWRDPAAVPPAPRSRALRDLQFKVMVSELVPPPADNSPPPSLFVRKVDRLAAMGEGESLNELVRSAGAYSDPAIAGTAANALLLAGERAGGCNIVQNQKLAQPFALRAEAACKLAAGDSAAALALVEGQKPRDNALFTLVQLAAGSLPPTTAPAGPVDGPMMVMLELAHVPPPAAVLQSTQPSIMRALVANKTLALPVRIEIAERGEVLAIIEATRLADLYVQAVREGVTLPPAMARRAQLVTAARDATNAQEIMTAITAVYAATRNSPLFTTMARATASALLNLPPKPEYANVAQEAMRGFLLLGDKKLSLAWTKLALNAAYNNARAMLALDRLMPLVMIAGIDSSTRLEPRDVDRWYEVIRQDDAKTAPMRGRKAAASARWTSSDSAALHGEYFCVLALSVTLSARSRSTSAST